MKKIFIGFKAYDPHELLCHFVARKRGAYEQAGLYAELTDTNFIPDGELQPETFQVSCGAALLSRLQGRPLRVVLVATDRPMFWLHSRSNIDHLPALRGHRIATYPPVAPPWHFARILCRQAGLDPDHDVSFVPARDDTARLGLLMAGDVDAAVISSAFPPARIERRGFRHLIYFGSALTVPTTGLAVNEALIESDPALVAAVVDIFRQSLIGMRRDVGLVQAVLDESFDFAGEPMDASTAEFQISFTKDGQIAPDSAQAAVDLMRGALGIPEEIAWKDVYDFSFLGDL